MGSVTSKFKSFDTRFTNHQIAVQRETWLRGFEFSEPIKRWTHHVDQWVQSFVQHCVYEASDHEEWQLFRVSLKGLTTYEKLYCLDRYLEQVNFNGDEADQRQAQKEKCRIDNYIGALVRGGQLNKNLEVMR